MKVARWNTLTLKGIHTAVDGSGTTDDYVVLGSTIVTENSNWTDHTRAVHKSALKKSDWVRFQDGLWSIASLGDSGSWHPADDITDLPLVTFTTGPDKLL